MSTIEQHMWEEILAKRCGCGHLVADHGQTYGRCFDCDCEVLDVVE